MVALLLPAVGPLRTLRVVALEGWRAFVTPRLVAVPRFIHLAMDQGFSLIPITTFYTYSIFIEN